MRSMAALDDVKGASKAAAAGTGPHRSGMGRSTGGGAQRVRRGPPACSNKRMLWQSVLSGTGLNPRAGWAGEVSNRAVANAAGLGGRALGWAAVRDASGGSPALTGATNTSAATAAACVDSFSSLTSCLG